MFYKFNYNFLICFLFLFFSCKYEKIENSPIIIKNSFDIPKENIDAKDELVFDDSLIKEKKSKVDKDYSFKENVNIVHHKYYSFLYSEKDEQPYWVKYVSTKEHILEKKYKRKNNFREDPLVKTQSATLKDYSKSGYDRGHLCPAGDMCFSESAMSESFFMSNMSPQFPSFNRGKWKALEEKVRNWAVKYDTAIIYCGGVLSDISKTIGPNKVSVPKYYYKVVYCPTIDNAIGFIMPNIKCELSLDSYMVSIDSVERLTNIDFYNNYLPEVQKRFESNSKIKYWF